MAVYNSRLYVGGYTSNSGLTEIWSSNGSSWANASIPWSSGNACGALTTYNSKLYAGGNSHTENLWSYNGSTWTNVNCAGVLSVYALLGSGSNLYLGGLDASIGSGGIWLYNGSAWSHIYTYVPVGGNGQIPTSLAIYNGNLYAGGANIGGNLSQVLVYNGSSWTDTNIPVGSNEQVFSLVAFNDGATNKLYAGCYHSNALTGRVLSYNGVNWTDETITWTYPNVYAILATYNNKLYACSGSYGATPGQVWSGPYVPPSPSMSPSLSASPSTSQSILSPSPSPSQSILSLSPSPSQSILSPSLSPSQSILSLSPSTSQSILSLSPSPSQSVLSLSPSTSQSILSPSPSPSQSVLSLSPSPSQSVLSPSPSLSPLPTFVWQNAGVPWTGITECPKLITFNGNIYALGNSVGASTLWCFDGHSWAITRTFTSYGNDMAVYSGKLYVAVSNNHLWSFDGTDWVDFKTFPVYALGLATYNGRLYAVLATTPQTMVYYDGSTWTTDYGVFDGSTYTIFYSIAAAAGELFVSVRTPTNQNQIWQLNSSYVWSNANWVTSNGTPTSFGDYNSIAHAGTTGGTVWSFNGSAWANTGLVWGVNNLVLALVEFNSKFYAGNNAAGGGGAQVLSYDGSTWADTSITWTASNQVVDSMAVYNSKLYAASGNTTTGSQIWYASFTVLSPSTSPSPSQSILSPSPSPSQSVLSLSPSPSQSVYSLSPSPSQSALSLSPSRSRLSQSLSPSQSVLSLSPSPSVSVLLPSVSPSPSPSLSLLPPSVSPSPEPPTPVIPVDPTTAFLTDLLARRGDVTVSGNANRLGIELAGGQVVEMTPFEPDPTTYRHWYYYNTASNILMRKVVVSTQPAVVAYWKRISD